MRQAAGQAKGWRERPNGQQAAGKQDREKLKKI
jgi:hypothetical protein